MVKGTNKQPENMFKKQPVVYKGVMWEADELLSECILLTWALPYKDPSASDPWKREGLSLVECGCLLLRWKKVYTITSPSWKTAAWDGSLQSLPVDISWTAFSFSYMQSRLVQLWVEFRFQLFRMHACCFFVPCHPSAQSQAWAGHSSIVHDKQDLMIHYISTNFCFFFLFRKFSLGL